MSQTATTTWTVLFGMGKAYVRTVEMEVPVEKPVIASRVDASCQKRLVTPRHNMVNGVLHPKAMTTAMGA